MWVIVSGFTRLSPVLHSVEATTSPSLTPSPYLSSHPVSSEDLAFQSSVVLPTGTLTRAVTAAKEIVSTEGLLGLFGRGLPTRLMTNGLQGLLFSILWKLFTDM